MKILLGIDDSAHSRAAIEFVRKTAWPTDTEVVVLSVVQPVTAVYSEIYVPAILPAEITEDLVRAHHKLASDAEQLLKSDQLRLRSKVLQGDPRAAIVDAAHDEQADLVVVGSHGRTGLAKLFMGSVAQHVVTHAPCSVLVVKLQRK